MQAANWATILSSNGICKYSSLSEGSVKGLH